MNYHSRAKKRSFGPVSVIVSVVIVSLLFGLFARSFVVKIFSDVGNGVYYFIPNVFKSAQETARENIDLQEEVARLTALNADRNTLEKENEELKAGFGRADDEKIVYAVVIKRPPGSLYDTFILDAGEETGIKSGDEVMFGSVLVGSIVESGVRYSKAKLLSSQGNTFQGTLGASTSVEVKGLGGGSFEAMVPVGIEVSNGDALILPSLSPKIFGLVQKIEDKSEEGFKRVLFSLPINPNLIRSVGVVAK